MVISKGTTRIVFVFKNYVIKVPNFINGYKYGFKFILQGLLSNLMESEWGKFKDARLCPLIFSFPFGLFVVMKTAKCVGKVHHSQEMFNGLPYDAHDRNFGLYKGSVVMIDYGGGRMK